MRTAYLCLLVFIFTFASAVQLPPSPFFKDVKAGVCDYAKIKQDITQFVDFLKSDNYSSPEAIATFAAGVTNAATSSSNCLAKIGDWVTGTTTVSKTMFTDACLNTDPSQTANDVCCNSELEEKQCCAPRNHTFSSHSIDGFNSALNSSCGQPAKAAEVLRTFVDKFFTKLQTCTSSVQKKLKRDFEIFQRMGQCWTEVFAKPADCTNDADCDGGNGVCNPLVGKCLTTGQENVEPLVRCIFKNIPEWMKRVFRLNLGIKGIDTDATLYTKFKDAATVSECYVPVLGNNYVFTKSSQFSTEATCIAEKVCNIPGGCANNNSQCVVGCGLNGVCSSSVDVFKTESSCKEFGYCFGNGYLNGLSFFNATTCAEKKMCTDFLACENAIPACTETTCTTKGRCVGFPFAQATCVTEFKFEAGTGQKTCGLGETQREFGCESSKGSIQCAVSGGRMIQVPTNSAECLAHKICVNAETKTPNLMNEQTCTKCKGNYVSAFTWVPAQWKSAALYQPQKWVAGKMVSKNRWIQGVDVVRLTGILTTVIYLQAINSYKSLYQCAFYPMVKLAETIACDCGTPKAPAGTNCYAPLVVPVGSFRVFSGVSHTSKNSDYDITPDKNAVSETQDYIDAQVTRTEVKSALSASASADLLVSFDTKATASGYLTSDGYSASTSNGAPLAGKTNLCIKRTVASVPAEYSVAGFATLSNGQILRSSVVLTNTDFSAQMCGDVTDTNTYYMAFFKEGTPTSDSSNITFSAVIFVVAIVLSLFA